MNLLAIETSTDRASVSLSNGNSCWGEEDLDIKRHAEWVLPSVERLLQHADLKVQELDGIVFGQGPGSFTGLRVACALAKGLALGVQCLLYPVSGLLSIAYQVKSPRTLVVLDARMQEWYWAEFEGNKQVSMAQVGSPSVISLTSTDSFVLAGVGFETLIDKLPVNILQRIAQKQVCYPNASSMISLVQSGHVAAVTPDQASPHYLRDKVT